MLRYPILQSGFCALSEKGLIRVDTNQGEFQARLLMREHAQVINRFFYHARVDEMYRSYVVTPSLLQNMEFREEILKIAKELLGGNIFTKWLTAQMSSNRIGAMHAKFIEETAEMLLYSNPRRTHISLWHVLLDASVASRSVNVDYSDVFQKSIKNHNRSSAMDLNASIPSVLANWTSLPDGFEDLFTFLYTVYGNRSVRTDVANRSSI